MTPRGICPIIDEITAEEDRKPFEVYGDTFKNYSSLADDPEGAIALEGLATSGFVNKFHCQQGMRDYLK